MNLRSICKVPFAVTPECRSTRITPQEFLSMEQHLCSSTGELHPANCLAGAFRIAARQSHGPSKLNISVSADPTACYSRWGKRRARPATDDPAAHTNPPPRSSYSVPITRPRNSSQDSEPTHTTVLSGGLPENWPTLIRSVRTQASLSISTYRSLPSTDSKPGNGGRTSKILYL